MGITGTVKKDTGKSVLWFFSSTVENGALICSKYLNDYQDSLNILTGMGVNVVAVTPESIENVEQTVKLHNLTFTGDLRLSGTDNEGLQGYVQCYQSLPGFSTEQISIDIAKNNGRDVAHLPVPATYIISREGIIVAV